MAQTHVCSLCNEEFTSEGDYIDHKCSATGYTPADPEHQGEDFALVQSAALQRGLDKAETDKEKKRTQAAIDDLGVTPPEPQ